MIARRNFFLRLCGGVLAAASAPVALWAEAKSKHRQHPDAATPDPAAAANSPAPKNAVARLRLWKASDSPEQPVQIRFLLQGKPDSSALSPLQIETVSYQFSNYVEMPAGSMIAEVSSPGRPTVLLPMQLTDGSQATLLVRAQGAGLTAEWIDDTPSPADSGCEFSVYNLLPASGDIQIDVGSILTVHLSSIRSCLRLTGVKKANYPVVANGVDGSGKNFHWSTDADLRQARKATLLIYPDAYGRIRPRINSV